jgi:hypothetical protein
MERFLYRLSQSAHAHRFVLKGALMLRREAGFILNEKRRTDQRIYYQLQKDTGLPLNFPIMEVAAMIFAEQAGMGLVGRRSASICGQRFAD